MHVTRYELLSELCLNQYRFDIAVAFILCSINDSDWDFIITSSGNTTYILQFAVIDKK